MANPTQLYRRNSTWRKNVLRSLSTEIIVNGKITTTLTRAKELRKVVDKLITKGKKNTLASRRLAAASMRKIKTKDGTDALKYLFDTLAPKYKNRNGGYTRIIKLPPRQGDNTKMAIIELV
ncbi:50S RIBOSOMAL PROTEIN L17 [Mycoplasmopsis pulmonis]|uniref:Large ribosomal subunit protein bL17 n=1 Tax=Mycoplasmopsis pulmonis (strain UAB CTIP) TaxID=272635 RepID=RL17_MYCPU|nr:50S ribosomal protein L17 [Mycoplasmopsis pulmonis]Q98Q09.1 RecName: Full=Large ribosomal subunit protein bL17; AltName: Full=50S ribosomal protein L17 [Mycoplasmopsis pulmonis UAB CTIP]MDZ7293636.1 50S ribosomal protein L17 [Mycoplasmopsis pulmonis]CAC13733.1 50S RIBOSOMAL PROTEIN L17 [Mycoplasmopsis pulmonis]VEU68325.1 50S ribosomal protein L17 [Mycoplasmopsis pulmonis]